jgi:YggT family protein
MISGLLQIYTYVLLARILMSWIPLDRSNPTVDRIVQFLYDITEPVLQPARNILPSMGGMDFSPLLVFVGINFVASVLRANGL